MADVVWVLLSVGVAFAGLIVLSACAFRVFLEVRGLARELERTRRRLGAEHTALRTELSALRRAGEPTTSTRAYDSYE